MQSSVPKRNTGKCLLTVGTDVKNVTEGRGTEGRGGEEGTRLCFLCGLILLNIFATAIKSCRMTNDVCPAVWNQHQTQGKPSQQRSHFTV